MTSDSSTRLVIGLDFGTRQVSLSFRVAFAEIKGNSLPDIRDIRVISQWRGSGSSTYDLVKVPTKIIYGDDSQITWGYEVSDGEEPIDLIKLLLLPESELRTYLQGQDAATVERSRDKITSLGKTVTSVIQDYLRELWKYSLGQIKASIGQRSETLPLHVILTVPAIWSEVARQNMLHVAKQAGICDDRACGKTRVELVDEPQAAATAVLFQELRKRHDLEPGARIVVTDLGGGTASGLLAQDVITYAIEEIDPAPKFRECVEGAGGLYGGNFPDREFKEALKLEIGRQRWKECSPFHDMILRESWQYSIKPSFDNSDQLWHVNTYTSGTCQLNSEQIAECFDNTVTPGIVKLVKGQIQQAKAASKSNTPPELICLVGGFGRSPYIYKVLHDKLCRGHNIELIQTRDNSSWSAVALGAVLTRAVQPESRVARYSYGWSTNEEFDPDHHLIEDRYYDDCRSVWMARNQVHWPIKRGDRVQHSANGGAYDILFLHDEKGIQTHKARFYKSALRDPPKRVNAMRNVAISEDAAPGVVFLGNIELTTPVRVQNLPKVSNGDGQSFHKFEWTWKINVSGNSVNMIATTSDGEEVGKLDIGDITKE
ncbi:hypothetical protein DL766_009145 [Monosporascus sp. MC13-8B]|uniref:Uncharacterized protein n=1 Tax=Monosporascus cannonballus TaxID=155416 RepID=A0ABY0H2W0_9PEZI|nr:hypothetical protein DL762_007403 [Monosporascus cannonballus]RYO81310.1 hypothetical protein DL763_008616 [Monosporascus cannonballus]RYP16361.1 hypothetical protein DL766_009145 [Monosporascus sp. MC13-8B]